MLNTTQTVIPVAGYEAVSLDGSGEIVRWPVLAFAIVHGGARLLRGRRADDKLGG